MEGLRSKAISAVKWTALERVGIQILQFVIGIVVARLISPSEYGIIGMLTIFISLGSAILDSGFGTALIQLKEKTNIDYSTAFYFNVAVGLFVYLLLYICAPFIAGFYNLSALVDITRVYGITLFINSLTIAQTAKLTSELCFKLQFYANSISLALSGIVGIVMAYCGLGVWALVAQNVLCAFIRMILFWCVSKWRPLFRFSIQSFKSLFSFGSKMLLISFIDIIYDNIYALIIGKYYKTLDVGYYVRSQQFVSVPQSVLQQVVLKVSLPVLSPLQDDNIKLLSAYEKIFTFSLFFVYPFLISIIVLSSPIIYVLLGEKWMPCVPYLQILSFGMLWIPLTLINLNLIIVKGRSDIILKAGILKKMIGFIIVFITLQLGMYWICWGTTVYALIAFLINANQTDKLLDYGLIKQLKVVYPIFIKSLLMGGIMFITIFFIVSPLLKILVGVSVGILSYTLLAIVTKDISFVEVYNIILNRK